MIKMYNLKIMHKSGDETIPSLNLWALAGELTSLPCSAKEFDYISEIKKGGTYVAACFQVKRYN